MTAINRSGLLADPTVLTAVFELSRAAYLLRRLGLAAMTERALRARAYERQVPFHVIRHRITFTLDDIKEIAAREPYQPPCKERPEL